MNDLLQRRTVKSTNATPTGSAGPVVFTTTGDKFLHQPAAPIDVYRWGIMWTVAKDASNMVVKLDLRPTIGSDTNRVTQDTMTDASARAAGIVTERVIPGSSSTTSTGIDGSTVNVAPIGLHVVPGNELVVTVATAAASTGQGYIYIDYAEHAAVTKANVAFYNSTSGTDYANVVEV